MCGAVKEKNTQSESVPTSAQGAGRLRSSFPELRNADRLTGTSGPGKSVSCTSSVKTWLNPASLPWPQWSPSWPRKRHVGASHWENLRGLQNVILKERRTNGTPKGAQRETESISRIRSELCTSRHIYISVYEQMNSWMGKWKHVWFSIT